MEQGSNHGATAGSSTTSTHWEDAVESIATYVSESLPPTSLRHAVFTPASARLAAVQQLMGSVHAKLLKIKQDRLLTVTSHTLALEEQANELAPDLFESVEDLDHRMGDILRQARDNHREIKELETKLDRLFAIEADDHHQLKATLGVIANSQMSNILREAALKLWRCVFDGAGYYRIVLGMLFGMCCLHLLVWLKGERELPQDWAAWVFLSYIPPCKQLQPPNSRKPLDLQTAAVGGLKALVT
ncbi:hypothetical protein K474DRAFT_1679480 [Panus rudis PR-1116 ss-1]|nr:hypothetical protein K474DRAFT_1679480 [Panus rudis PR-1116 ss-1]